ncbi:NACHT domain-containing protein, partial [Lentzea sp. NPDC006480]|uniref:NACHT domain-containing protein n=1 Tax=Lentzea sp. NPDC006480 TaxID=3157176 RepID=UPI0033BAC3A0
MIEVLTILLLAGSVIAILTPIAAVLRKCWNAVRWMTRGRIGDERRRQRRRKMFAKHLHNVLWNIELQEDWRDEKYAELEAEVEIERSWRRRWMLRLLPFRRPALRRVDSLSEALRRSSEPLILLEGEPGAGKSVALRHLARVMIGRAVKSDKPKVILPLYINLKSLDIRPDLVSPDGIRAFLLAKLAEANSRDIQEVLDEEFDRGLKDGTWLFLFDSFDEIPDILSADDAQQIAPKYAQAIAGFLGPFTRCRGIVASRDFSSPNIVQFTRFRILRLSPRQQRKLIKRADLDRPVYRAMLEGLATASQDITTFAGNPMFLGLLCEHMRIGIEFPASSHTVFEQYLTHRLRRDRDRIRARFGRDVDFIRAGAEEIAFLMASTPRMGLTPTRSVLRAMAPAMQRVAPTVLNTILDALVYSKLGRADSNADGEPTFSFVHRRFQEYFSTCVVISDPKRVPMAVLLENDQWRETAVTLLQVQDSDATRPLLADARGILRRHAAAVIHGDFRWPPGCLHLLGILATGLETHPAKVTDEIRSLIDCIVQRAWNRGHRLDKRRAVAFAGLLTFPIADELLTAAFRSRNEFLREVAFRTAGSLPQLSEDLRGQIRLTLLGLTCSTAIYTKRASAIAQIKRLAHPREFLTQLDLLTITFPLALMFSAGGVVLNAFSPTSGPLPARIIASTFYVFMVTLVLKGLFWITARLRTALPPTRSRSPSANSARR